MEFREGVDSLGKGGLTLVYSRGCQGLGECVFVTDRKHRLYCYSSFCRRSANNNLYLVFLAGGGNGRVEGQTQGIIEADQ